MKKTKGDFRCDKCGLEVDVLYFCHGREICENCKKVYDNREIPGKRKKQDLS